jgi:hypothetical protein
MSRVPLRTPARPRRPDPRTIARWVGLAAVLVLLGGRAGLALAVAIVLWDLLWAPAPRTLIAVALVGFLAVPVVVLVRGLPTEATLSPEFAAGSRLPHLLAGASLALLVLGVLRDVRADLPPPSARPELAAPGAAPDRALLPPPQPGEQSANGEEPR